MQLKKQTGGCVEKYVNLMFTVVLEPDTCAIPLEGEHMYSLTGVKLNWNVPLNSTNCIELAMDVISVPFSITDQKIPEFNPVSLKDTIC